VDRHGGARGVRPFCVLPLQLTHSNGTNSLPFFPRFWQTLQDIVDAIYPGGVRVILKPNPVADQKLVSRLRKQDTRSVSGRIEHLEISRRGALASVRARLAKHTPEQRSRYARMAARARSAALTPAERSEIARGGALERWARRQEARP
jgi:hypothetical protein